MVDWSAYYQSRYTFDSQRGVVWQCLAEWLQPEIPEDSTVLELGAGYCDFINRVRARRKVAVDIASVAATSANSDVQVHVGSCSSLPFLGDATVDVIFASNLLEHLTLDEATRALHEALRVLRPCHDIYRYQPG